VDFSLSALQQAFVTAAEDFAATRVRPRAAEIDGTAAYPRDLIVDAARLGLTGVTIPAEWGGQGRDYVAYALAIEAIAAESATVAVSLVVTNSLVAEPLVRFGSDEAKTRWLRALAAGEAIGAFALSESHAGSDATNQRTTAVAEGGGYRLTGEKVWVANGEAADVAIVFAALDPGASDRGITAFLVPLDRPGLTRHGCDSLGVRGLGCTDLHLDGVRVEAGERLGEAGQGLPIALAALEGGRVAIAAQALGVGRSALDEAIAYTRTRHAFGHRIGDFQAIQFQLADLAAGLEAARMLMWKAADAHDRLPRAALEAAMAKLHASEAAHVACDRAMQILASAGYRRGSRLERLFRDIRAAEIYQGTSEVQRLIIASHVVDREG
jgi:alkylation response protein AidB-like acyl-CoA dehydrogenase